MEMVTNVSNDTLYNILCTSSKEYWRLFTIFTDVHSSTVKNIWEISH